MLPVEQLTKLMKASRVDARPLVEHAFWITTKGLPGQEPIMRFVLNEPQRRINKAIVDARKGGIPPRIISLKARQPGVSTYAESQVMATALSKPHTTSLIVAHIDEASSKLYEKCLLMLDRLPRELRPLEAKRRRGEFRLRWLQGSDGRVELNSTVMVATASGKELWRGLTITTAHLSEFSRFPYPDLTLAGLIQAVPKSPESLVLIESTANGEGDCFHREWLRAETGESGFIPVFIPWWELPDARMPVPASFELDSEERDLQRAYGLSHEQLQWRRFVLHSECQGNIDLFNQEYPATPEIAFLTSGMPAFPAKALMEMAERARLEGKPQRGELYGGGEGAVLFSQMQRGRLAIYKMPEPGHDYTIGADVAAGVEGGDYSAAVVYDRMTSEVVAVWHGHISPIEFANQLIRLGFFYQQALLAPEITGGHGFSVIAEIKSQFYPRIYVYQRVDKIRNTITNFLGWETTFRTRGLLLDTMHWALGNHEIMIWDQQVIQELREMRYGQDGKAVGMRYDDLAMAVMIALRAHVEMPMTETGLPPRLKPPRERHGPEVAQPPPLPERGMDRLVWQETDRILRSYRHSRRRTIDEYGEMPDAKDDALWEPGGESWIPEIPW